MQPTDHSFRELDAAAGSAKGSAFRAFKALAGELQEGIDFVCVDARADAVAFAHLRDAGRLYPGTVNAVLLAPDAAARVLARLHAGTTPDRGLGAP